MPVWTYDPECTSVPSKIMHTFARALAAAGCNDSPSSSRHTEQHSNRTLAYVSICYSTERFVLVPYTKSAALH
jgi:hypothetical protein